jgi:hypothetical protein
MDLVIGRREGDLEFYYENTGNATHATYTSRKGAPNPFDGVADVGYYSFPAFVDVDGDGDMDLVIGRGEGDLKFYYENTGSASNPSYTRREGALNPFDGVADVGSNSVPAFVDTDNDGDMDLVIGRREGDLKFYYENTGTPTDPSYTRREGALNPFDGVADVGSLSAPAFVDTDDDGDMDLVIGRRAGDLKFYYENTGTPTDPSYKTGEGATALADCTGCATGRFSNETGQTHCLECAPATYQNDTGRTGCKHCPAGFISAVRSSYCHGCAPGTREDGTRRACANCTKGKYATLRHQTECSVCPSGTYQAHEGKHWCQACGRGKYLADDSATDASAHDNADDCEGCPAGTKILDDGGKHLQYVQISAGMCGDENGRTLLTSAEEGLSAMTFFDLPSPDPRKSVGQSVSSTTRPKGFFCGRFGRRAVFEHLSVLDSVQRRKHMSLQAGTQEHARCPR